MSARGTQSEICQLRRVAYLEFDICMSELFLVGRACREGVYQLWTEGSIPNSGEEANGLPANHLESERHYSRGSHGLVIILISIDRPAGLLQIRTSFPFFFSVRAVSAVAFRRLWCMVSLSLLCCTHGCTYRTGLDRLAMDHAIWITIRWGWDAVWLYPYFGGAGFFLVASVKLAGNLAIWICLSPSRLSKSRGALSPSQKKLVRSRHVANRVDTSQVYVCSRYFCYDPL